MRHRWLPLVIGANLLALLSLAFIYPHLMVSPGPLIPAHRELTTNCFACHSPWRGADPQRCIRCHAVAGIGLRTTQGVPLDNRAVKISFHQELTEQDCVACHNDHEGLMAGHSRKPFSHSLLRPAIREQCEACHQAPTDRLHQELNTVSCAQCHGSAHWKPAAFNHATLPKAVLDRCESCHQGPNDSLHRQIRGNCGQCHGPQRWKPATFDHAKLFVLDRDHNSSCSTCHTGEDYSRYTCYGCHEHRPERIRAEHLEEGIQNFDDCVECHRSANAESERAGSHEKRERD